MKKLSIIYLLPLLLLIACQNDEELNAPHAPVITFGTASGGVGMEWENGLGTARATDDDLTDMPDDIGVFAYYDKSTKQEVFTNQWVHYFYSNHYTTHNFPWEYWKTDHHISAWPYTIADNSSEQKLWEKQRYRFVAYSPWSDTGVSVSSSDYDFNTVNWAKIPEYSDRDYLIAKKIVDVDNTGGLTETADLVSFEMQHLMARIRFIFKMHPEYRKIRRIVINSVSVNTSGKQNSATITYKADNTLNNITWGGLTDGAPPTVTLIKEDSEAYDVKTNYDYAPSFASLYLLPNPDFHNLTITVSYSTYDSAGVKTRDAQITNTIHLTTPWNLRAGRYYDMKIFIFPKYLYVLSDNDQDFDGWVIVDNSDTNTETPTE